MKQWIPIAYDHALSVVSILDSPETSQKSNRSKAVGTNIQIIICITRMRV